MTPSAGFAICLVVFWLAGSAVVLVLPVLSAEEVGQCGEIFLQEQSYALCVETVACELAVVCLVVVVYGEIAVGVEQILEVEIADKACCGIGLVAVSELAVYE